MDKLNRMKTPYFNMVLFYDQSFKNTINLLHCCSPQEVSNIGMFLAQILSVVEKYRVRLSPRDRRAVRHASQQEHDQAFQASRHSDSRRLARPFRRMPSFTPTSAHHPRASLPASPPSRESLSAMRSSRSFARSGTRSFAGTFWCEFPMACERGSKAEHCPDV